MDTLLQILSLLFAAMGLVGSIIPGVVALAMSVMAMVILLFTATPPLTVADLFIYIAIALLATLSSRHLSPRVTARWGGTRSGYWGAAIGTLAGFVLYPPLGVLLAPLFFAIMGEMVNDRSDVERTFKAGFASFFAFLVGAWLQFIVALWVIWLINNSFLPELLHYIGI